MIVALRDAVTDLFTVRTPMRSSAEVNEACRRYVDAIRVELKLPPDTSGAEVMQTFIENVPLRNEVKALIRKIRGEQ